MMTTTLTKVKAALAVPLLPLLMCCPVAHADVGGAINGIPGLCDYPGVGGSGAIGPAVFYWCDFPTEENGSHWHCELNGALLQGGFTLSFLMFGGTITGNVGAVLGSCTFRCPDMALSATPNPPGAWKNTLTPKRCVSLGNPIPAGQTLFDPSLLAPVTNPDAPNPDATQNR